MFLEPYRHVAGVRAGIDLEIVGDAVGGQGVVRFPDVHLEAVLIAWPGRIDYFAAASARSII